MKDEIAVEKIATSAVAQTVEAGTAVTEKSGMTRMRWTICALLFFATTINYIDRQVLGILSKDLQAAFGWNELQYGNIVASFNAAYALGLLVAGRLMDRFGTTIGYSVALAFGASQQWVTRWHGRRLALA